MSPDAFHVRGNTQRSVSTPALNVRLMVPSSPARDIAVHRHNDAHLILVLRGDYQTSATRNGTLHSETPLLILNPPRTEHVDCFEAKQILPLARFYSLTLAPSTWIDVIRSMDLPTTPHAMQGAASVEIAANLSKSSNFGFDMEDALISALAPFSQDAALGAKDSACWVGQVKKFLRDLVLDGQASMRMTEVAIHFDVHPVYLARAFRNHTGVSPSSYVRAVQLDKAAALLAHSSKPITEISMECLFFDHAHLTHTFQNAYGLSPSAFRGLQARRVIATEF